MTTLLDLDDPAYWHDDFRQLIYSDRTWTEISLALNAGESPPMSFYTQVTCANEYLRDPLAQRLRSAAMEIFLGRYTFVTACHGCIVVDRHSYLTNGIVVSNPAVLIAVARNLFDGIPGFDDALRDIGQTYLNHNEGKVGLLLSCMWAQHSRNKYCTGSELISALSNRLGEEAQRRFQNTGRPMFIRCKVPIEWLDTSTTFPVRGSYVNEVIVELIRQRQIPGEHWHGVDGGYLLTKTIPPEYILEFVDMTGAMKEPRFK